MTMPAGRTRKLIALAAMVALGGGVALVIAVRGSPGKRGPIEGAPAAQIDEPDASASGVVAPPAAPGVADATAHAAPTALDDRPESFAERPRDEWIEIYEASLAEERRELERYRKITAAAAAGESVDPDDVAEAAWKIPDLELRIKADEASLAEARRLPD